MYIALMGTLRDCFTLPDFWVFIDTRHDCPELPELIEQCVPHAFQDPIQGHVFLICRTAALERKARSARRRAKVASVYPDFATLVVFQGENVFWVRPNAGAEDPVGLWVLMDWIGSRYRYRVADESDTTIFRG